MQVLSGPGNPRRLAIRIAGTVAVALAAAGIGRAADGMSPSALKAAFLFNFAKFADWDTVPPSVTLVLCVANDDQVGAALTDSARGQVINGHAIEVRRVKSDNFGPSCHLLFVPASEAKQVLEKVGKVQDAPITVSDAPGFAQAGGVIELFQEGGRMRFAVNVDTTQRLGVRLSSRLLDLAKIVRTDHAQ